MAGILDSIRSLVPRQPSQEDVLGADVEMQDFAREQQALQQTRTIEESVERAVREELARVQKDKPQAANLNPMDHQILLSPEAQGDQYPTATGGALTYRTLDMMSRVPVISAIIETRLSQLADFCRRQRHKKELGFRVMMRDHARAPTAAALKRIAEIEAWYETCGDPTVQVDPSFSTFVQKVMRQSLTFDQACAEILLDKYGRPAAMIPVDAKTIRLAQVTDKELDKKQRGLRKQHYVQVLPDASIVARWDSEKFIFGTRRPRADIEAYGYGYPELEQLARIVTYLLQAEFYNAANFTNGVNAAGLLVVKSAMNEQQFQQLEKRMRQTLVGASNAHRQAMLQLKPGGGEAAESVINVPFNSNNRDMEFSQWVSWLLKIATALYNMDPAELNFIYGNENQKSSLGQQDPEDRISASKERGLRPLLRSLENWLNTAITYRLDEDFRLEFCGLDGKSPLVQSQLDTQSLMWTPINEVRARHDLPPIDHWSCDVPANPSVIGIIQQEKALAEQQQLQAQQAATPGAPTGLGGEDEALPETLPSEFADFEGPDGDIDFKAVEQEGRSHLPPDVNHKQVFTAEA